LVEQEGVASSLEALEAVLRRWACQEFRV
jgi:hypothetical protein